MLGFLPGLTVPLSAGRGVLSVSGAPTLAGGAGLGALCSSEHFLLAGGNWSEARASALGDSMAGGSVQPPLELTARLHQVLPPPSKDVREGLVLWESLVFARGPRSSRL